MAGAGWASAAAGSAASAGAAAGAAGACLPPAAMSAWSLANWSSLSWIRRCSLSIWLCRSPMRSFSSSFSRRVESRLSWVTASLSLRALLSPLAPLSLPLEALPLAPETRRRLSWVSTFSGASPALARLVASSWRLPSPARLRPSRQAVFCSATWLRACAWLRLAICCSSGSRSTWPLFRRLMLPSRKASGFRSWMASMAWWTEPLARVRSAISHRVSREVVRYWSVGALAAGAGVGAGGVVGRGAATGAEGAAGALLTGAGATAARGAGAGAATGSRGAAATAVCGE
ncbi:hypothetical protein D9M68_606260 [compost metagenome]